jgi:hypothetical protein
MKVELFKKLIKEAVREVVREELPTLLSENLRQTKTAAPTVQQVTKYENYKPTVARPVKTGDPIMDILNETRASMTQESYRDLVSATSDMVQAPGLGMNTVQNFPPGPAPGLDLSNLSFIKNAGAVFKASVEKDKARFGG